MREFNKIWRPRRQDIKEGWGGGRGGQRSARAWSVTASQYCVRVGPTGPDATEEVHPWRVPQVEGSGVRGKDSRETENFPLGARPPRRGCPTMGTEATHGRVKEVERGRVRQRLRRHSARLGRAVGHLQDGGRGGGEGLCPTALMNDWRTGGDAQHGCIGAFRGDGSIGHAGGAELCRAARAGGVGGCSERT